MGDFKHFLPKWFRSGKMFCSKSVWVTDYTIVSYYGTSWVGWDAVLSSHNRLYRSIVFRTSNSWHRRKWNWQNQDDHQGGQKPLNFLKKKTKGYPNKTPKLVKIKGIQITHQNSLKRKGTRIRHQNPLLNYLCVHYHMPPFLDYKKNKKIIETIDYGSKWVGNFFIRPPSQGLFFFFFPINFVM